MVVYIVKEFCLKHQKAVHWCQYQGHDTYKNNEFLMFLAKHIENLKKNEFSFMYHVQYSMFFNFILQGSLVNHNDA